MISFLYWSTLFILFKFILILFYILLGWTRELLALLLQKLFQMVLEFQLIQKSKQIKELCELNLLLDSAVILIIKHDSDVIDRAVRGFSQRKHRNFFTLVCSDVLVVLILLALRKEHHDAANDEIDQYRTGDDEFRFVEREFLLQVVQEAGNSHRQVSEGQFRVNQAEILFVAQLFKDKREVIVCL